RHSMRSVGEGVTAINDGIKALGFGFMDTEELGKSLAEAYIKKFGA
ncbi:MAG: SFCGS family glycine-rich protein, partial [Pseudolactococcus raffinolactis]